MVKLSNKQRHELEILKWWLPSGVDWGEITDQQADDFFAWSDRGIPHGRNTIIAKDGFTALFWAKNRRDLQIQSYKEDWNTIIDFTSFDDMPMEIVEDVAKRLKHPLITAYEKGRRREQ